MRSVCLRQIVNRSYRIIFEETTNSVQLDSYLNAVWLGSFIDLNYRLDLTSYDAFDAKGSSQNIEENAYGTYEVVPNYQLVKPVDSKLDIDRR